MKRLVWITTAVVAISILVIVLVIDDQNKQALERAAFEQLSPAYQEIPNYPGAQDIWRGATEEKPFPMERYV